MGPVPVPGGGSGGRVPVLGRCGQVGAGGAACWPGSGSWAGGRWAVAAVVPAHGEAGDDGGAAAADDQGASGGELADHFGGHDGVAAADVVVVAAVQVDAAVFLHGGGAAQGGGGVEGGGVGDAGEPDLGAGGVHDDPGSVGSPAGAELSFAVRHGDDLDAFSAGVCEPGRDRYRADLCDLVQGE